MSSKDDGVETKLMTSDTEVLGSGPLYLNYNTSAAQCNRVSFQCWNTGVPRVFMVVFQKSGMFFMACCAAFTQVLPPDPITGLLVTH